MVLKQKPIDKCRRNGFENDVKIYGTQAAFSKPTKSSPFENDVKMYGTQARRNMSVQVIQFENDVKMYGTQAFLFL